jgi:hypothetical protein
MKQHIVSIIAAMLLCATTANAIEQSSPNYTINAGRIVSGGTPSTDVSGMSNSNVSIGQAIYILPGGSRSPVYTTKPVAAGVSSGTCGVHSGDINCDGGVDIADALKALRIAVGLETTTTAQLAIADVAPLSGGRPAPDGRIDIADALVILEKSVGLVGW